MSLRVTSEAVQIHGGYGFTDEYSWRHYAARATARWAAARPKRCAT